jgi:two-component system alkaline phosphatase synthesis response regulator PhoP
LLLRVSKLIQRSKSVNSQDIASTNLFSFSEFTINYTTYEVHSKSGKTFNLSKKEVQLLKLLSEKSNEVVSRDTILENVWGYEVYPTSRTIDNFILNFRKYFEVNPKDPHFFHSIRGVGYKFTPKGSN